MNDRTLRGVTVVVPRQPYTLAPGTDPDEVRRELYHAVLSRTGDDKLVKQTADGLDFTDFTDAALTILTQALADLERRGLIVRHPWKVRWDG